MFNPVTAYPYSARTKTRVGEFGNLNFLAAWVLGGGFDNTESFTITFSALNHLQSLFNTESLTIAFNSESLYKLVDNLYP